jgi:hypothetical protein
MPAKEVWAARQLDELAAGGANLAAALKRQSPVCSRLRATRAVTLAATSEVTDLMGGLHSAAVPGPDSVAEARHLRSQVLPSLIW